MSPTQLTTSIPAALLTTEGTAQVKVLNPAGLESNVLTATITTSTTTPTPAPLVIGTSALLNGTVGASYSAALSASGGTPSYSWSLASGALPTGLALSASGAISGTPSSAGTFSFTAKATDSGSPAQTASKSFSITDVAPIATLSITTSSLAGATTGTAYSASLSASGGTPSYSWSLASGALPTGLSLSASGAISGTPSSAGTFSFTAKATDSGSPAQTASKSFSITAAAATSPSPTPTSGTMLLSVDSTNPRYFRNPAGNIVYLAGSNTSYDFQIMQGTIGTHDYNVTNFVSYLGDKVSRNQNYVRLWMWEQPEWQEYDAHDLVVSPAGPWGRSAICCSGENGSKNKFDLTTYSTAFDNELVARVAAARNAGVYVSVMLFDAFSIRDYGDGGINPWASHPLNVANNINGVNGDPGNTGQGAETQTLDIAAVTAVQDNAIKHVIDLLNGYDNVLWEVGNEVQGTSSAKTVAWVNHVVDLIHSYEAGRSKHPVLYSAIGGNWNTITDQRNSNAEVIAPCCDAGVDYLANPPAATTAKVNLAESDHISPNASRSSTDGVLWPWRAFTRGYNISMLEDTLTVLNSLNAVGDTRAYASQVDLRASTPSTTICDTTYALVNAGRSYIAFAPSGGTFHCNLSAGSGQAFSVEWWNAAGRTRQTASSISGGSASQAFTSPFGASPSVLLLQNIGSSGSSVSALSITTSSLAGGAVGVAYSATATATGGTPGYSWSVASGSLPAGLTLAATSGQISGTPSSAGTFSFTLRVSDSGSPAQTASKSFSITIAAGTQTSGSPSPGSNDSVIFQDDFESGSLSKWDETPSRYSVDNNSSRVYSGSYSLRGTIPAGYASGELNKWFMPGYDEIYVAVDALYSPGFVNGASGGLHLMSIMGNSTSNQWSASGKAGIRPSGTDFFLTDPLPETAGQTGSQSALPMEFYSQWPQMSCPADYNPSTNPDCYGNAILQSNPAMDGNDGQWHHYVFHVKANTVGLSDGLQEMWIDGQKKIAQTNMVWRTTTDLKLNQLSIQLYINDSPQLQYLWFDNVVVWMPAGTTTSAAPPPSSPTPLSISTSSLPAGQQNLGYSANVTATGGTPGYTWSIATGSLPPGLTLAATSGQISGTPNTIGTYSFTAKVTDTTGTNTSKAMSINIAPDPPSITTSSLPSGTQGTSYSAVITATGGTQPYTWSISSGSLAGGLTLGASSGTISGTPTVAGTFGFTVSATDAAGQSGSKGFSLSIAGPPSAPVPSGSFAPPNLFFDGFESGSASGWTTTIGCCWSYASSPVHSGSKAGAVTTGSGQCCDRFWVKTFSPSISGGNYFRAWYNFPTNFRWNTVDSPILKLMLWESYSGPMGRAYLNCNTNTATTCNVQFYSNDSGVNQTVGQLSADGKWHSLEVQMPGSTVNIWLDGVLHSFSDKGMGGYGVVDWKVGMYFNGPQPYGSGPPVDDTLYVDDVCASTTRCGP